MVNPKELIILVGPPGSGKSTYAKTALGNYTYINQDSQGKTEHFLKFTDAIQLEDPLLVIDRMNFDKKQRSRYLEIARAKGYRTKIIVLHESRETCLDRMINRLGKHENINNYETAVKVLNFFFKSYEKPSQEEADVVELKYPEKRKDVKVVIQDLDGSLCNLDHRLYFMKREKKDWKNFFKEMDKDTPYYWCLDILKGLVKQDYEIVYCSGRPDNYQEVTRNWLIEHKIPNGLLLMRSRNDHRSDTVIKEIILDFEIKTRYSNIQFAIDDRKMVVEMWRRNNIVCLACNEGDF